MDISNSLDSSWHLRAEMSRLLVALDGLLARQRQRGRTPAADAVQASV